MPKRPRAGTSTAPSTSSATSGSSKKRQKTSQKGFPVDDLPDVVLIHVFDFLALKDQKNAMMVNNRWKNLLQLNRFAKKTIWKFRYWFFSSERWCNIFMQSTRKFFHIFIEWDIYELDTRELQWRNEVFSHIGKETETITLAENHIRCEQEAFGQNFPKLKRIVLQSIEDFLSYEIQNSLQEVHVEDFDLHGTSAVNALKGLDNLKTLTISSITLDAGKSVLKMSKPLMELLDEWKIVQFKLTSSFNVLDEKEVTASDILSLKRKDSYDFITAHIPDLMDFTSLEKVSFYTREKCFFIHECCENWESIKQFSVFFCSDTHVTEYCDECLQSVLKCCPNINSWGIYGSIKKIQQFIDQIPNTIRHLSINSNEYIDNFIVKHSGLETLEIWPEQRFGTKYQEFYDIKSWVYLPQLKKISLKLCKNFLLSDLKNLFRRCPALTNANLDNILEELMDFASFNYPNLKEFTYTIRDDEKERRDLLRLENLLRQIFGQN